ncbi:MAG: TetR family transcriptional regulator [Nocardioides sp.]|uniref:TetR/AcrR family transcriptional regulator n=1 Tax=Nocardioides sp. TaxID=35761 RepID=UPI0039E63C7B
MTDPAPTSPRASGRRPGPDSSRADILRAAQRAFAATGYDGTSVRRIAAVAGVDPSTVLHFFGTKERLFQEVVEEVAGTLRPVLTALSEGAPGRELALRYLEIWDDEDSGPAIRALVRATLGSERAIELLRDTMLGTLLAAVPDSNHFGAQLALSHLLGTAIARHLGRLPALAEADLEVIAAHVGPSIDRYLVPRNTEVKDRE